MSSPWPLAVHRRSRAQLLEAAAAPGDILIQTFPSSEVQHVLRTTLISCRSLAQQLETAAAAGLGGASAALSPAVQPVLALRLQRATPAAQVLFRLVFWHFFLRVLPSLGP